MSRRRRANETVHDYQHALIEERRAAWAAEIAEKGSRSLAARLRTNRAVDAVRTLTAHVSGEHGHRGGFLGMTYAEVAELHDRLHKESSETA